MKISLNWIRDFVELADITPAELMERVTMATAEVEEVETCWEHLHQVVTARVTQINPHPNADKLRLVRVNDGQSEMEVVCGAPNVAMDQIVALAKIGTKLPGGELKASSIRGIRSEGMICAEDELGLSESHEGILIFPQDTPIGITLDKLYGPMDIVLEVDNKSLTNRPDLWGHVGFSRELAAIYNKPQRFSVDESLLVKPENPDPLRIDNQTSELCPRYSALVVNNVEVKPSPAWMQHRLRSVGLRPINNLVDVTNYVMLELGQPMHAFDRRQIQGDCIVIRTAKADEIFTTLDENEHKLLESDIVIADTQRAVALGGVMGGMNSEIVDDTTCVVLESANFHPATIRRTANRLNLRTDSAQRFEKGQDPAATYPSIIRAVELIRETCPQAQVVSEFLDAWPSPPETIKIDIDFEHIHTRLGERLPEEQIIGILESLRYGVERNGQQLHLTVPSYRATGDVSMKADIVEEIGRIYGYDNITPIAPLVLSDPPRANLQRELEWQLRDILCQKLNFDEVSNYSFANPQTYEKAGFDTEGYLRLRNPISVDADRMRGDLIPQIIANCATNQKHFEQFRLFELGRTIRKQDRNDKALANETTRLCGAVYGEEETPFYVTKGLILQLLEEIRLPNVQVTIPQNLPSWLHPGRSIQLNFAKKTIGLLGELHPRIADRFELKKRVALFDLDVDLLFNLPRKKLAFEPLQRFPVNPVEITVVVDRTRPVAEIEQVIRKAAGKRLFDMAFLYKYEGERLTQGKKAVTYRVVFGAKDCTLAHEETAALHEGLLKALRDANMPIRGEE